jgi:AbrB family looped-hinge helix DNA binding protein
MMALAFSAGGTPQEFGTLVVEVTGDELTRHTPYLKVRKKEFAMATATLSSKGQITIPVEVRNDLKVDTGDRVEFVQIGPGRYEFVAVTREVTELKGMFGKPKKSVSIEAMNAAIAQRGGSAR